MKNKYYTFFVFDYSSKSIKSIFNEELNELLKSFEISYSFLNQDILLINGDIEDDVKESIKSLVIDFDEEVKTFEGFRIRNIENINLIKDIYIKNSIKSYMKIVDLLEKISDKEIKETKEFILDGLKNDSTYYQIIYSMFSNNLNISKTADEVYMHRNSIMNKLDLIQKETGLDMRIFKEAAVMYNMIKK